MRISEFIKRLEELREVAGEDVQVAIATPDGYADYEAATAELCHVTRRDVDHRGVRKWVSREEDNTEKIVSVW